MSDDDKPTEMPQLSPEQLGQVRDITATIGETLMTFKPGALDAIAAQIKGLVTAEKMNMTTIEALRQKRFAAFLETLAKAQEAFRALDSACSLFDPQAAIRERKQ